MQVVVVEPGDLDQLRWVYDRHAAPFERHRTREPEFFENAVDMNRCHTERIGEDDLRQRQGEVAVVRQADNASAQVQLADQMCDAFGGGAPPPC